MGKRVAISLARAVDDRIERLIDDIDFPDLQITRQGGIYGKEETIRFKFHLCRACCDLSAGMNPRIGSGGTDESNWFLQDLDERVLKFALGGS